MNGSLGSACAGIASTTKAHVRVHCKSDPFRLASGVQMPDDFRAITRRLIDGRDDLSVEELGYRAREWAKRNPAHNGDEGGVSLSLIQKRLAPSATKPPSLRLLTALAAGLEVEPATFPEYRLARARRLLDEREVGLDEALQNLARVESVLLSREEAPETPSPTLRDTAEEADRRSSGSRGKRFGDESPTVAPVSRRRRSA